MTLLLYVDDLFVTGVDGLIADTNLESCRRVQDEGLGYDTLISRHGGVVEYRWNLLGTREVCNRDPEEVWDDGLQGHDHTYGIEPEDIE